VSTYNSIQMMIVDIRKLSYWKWKLWFMNYAIEDPFYRAVTIAVHETHRQNIGNNLPTYIIHNACTISYTINSNNRYLNKFRLINIWTRQHVVCVVNIVDKCWWECGNYWHFVTGLEELVPVSLVLSFTLFTVYI